MRLRTFASCLRVRLPPSCLLRLGNHSRRRHISNIRIGSLPDPGQATKETEKRTIVNDWISRISEKYLDDPVSELGDAVPDSPSYEILLARIPPRIRLKLKENTSIEVAIGNIRTLVEAPQPRIIDPEIVAYIYNRHLSEVNVPPDLTVAIVRFMIVHCKIEYGVRVLFHQCLRKSRHNHLNSSLFFTETYTTRLSSSILNSHLITLLSESPDDHLSASFVRRVVSKLFQILNAGYHIIPLEPLKSDSNGVAIRQLLASVLFTLQSRNPSLFTSLKMLISNDLGDHPLKTLIYDGYSTFEYLFIVSRTLSSLDSSQKRLIFLNSMLEKTVSSPPIVRLTLFQHMLNLGRFDVLKKSLLKTSEELETFRELRNGETVLRKGGILLFICPENSTSFGIKLIEALNKASAPTGSNLAGEIASVKRIQPYREIGFGENDIHKLFWDISHGQKLFFKRAVEFLATEGYLSKTPDKPSPKLPLSIYYRAFSLLNSIDTKSYREFLEVFRILCFNFNKSYGSDQSSLKRDCLRLISRYVCRFFDPKVVESMKKATDEHFCETILKGVFDITLNRAQLLISRNRAVNTDLFRIDAGGRLPTSFLKKMKSWGYLGSRDFESHLLRRLSNHLAKLYSQEKRHRSFSALELTSASNFESLYGVSWVMNHSDQADTMIKLTGVTLRLLSYLCKYDKVDLDYQIRLIVKLLQRIDTTSNLPQKSEKMILCVSMICKEGAHLQDILCDQLRCLSRGFLQKTGFLLRMRIFPEKMKDGLTRSQILDYIRSFQLPRESSSTTSSWDLINTMKLDAARFYVEKMTANGLMRSPISHVLKFTNFLLKPSNVKVFCWDEEAEISEAQLKDLQLIVKSKLRQSMILGCLGDNVSTITPQKFAIAKAVIMMLITQRVKEKSNRISGDPSTQIRSLNASSKRNFDENEAYEICIDAAKFLHPTRTTFTYDIESSTLERFTLSYIRYNLKHNLTSYVFLRHVLNQLGISSFSEQRIHTVFRRLHGEKGLINPMYEKALRNHFLFLRKMKPALQKATRVRRRLLRGFPFKTGS